MLPNNLSEEERENQVNQIIEKLTKALQVKYQVIYNTYKLAQGSETYKTLAPLYKLYENGNESYTKTFFKGFFSGFEDALYFAAGNSGEKIEGSTNEKVEEPISENTKGESKAVESAKDILSNINKVGYGETDLGEMAIEYRKANNITSAGRNVAVFKYIDSNGEIRYLTTVSNKFDHAEEVALNYFKENGISGENIKSIYSEREPCISTPTNGTKNCTGKINEYCPDAEVTYTVDYGDTPESGRNARNELKNLIDESMK